MEDKKNKPVPEKNAKKPTGKSATGKPLDGIDVNPQLDDKRRTNEDFAVLTASLQERKALTITQRQARSRQLKRIEPKLKRAKEVSKQRLAGPKKLQARAEAKARSLLKKRFSSRKDIPYAELTTAEKIQVDTAVAKKTKLIKRLAARLLPKIRKAEYERLSSFHGGAPMKSLHSVPTAEDFSNLFHDLNDKSTLELVDIIENAILRFEKENNPVSITLRRMLNSTVGSDPITETLIKKAEKTGIPFSTLKEVYERGASLYEENDRQTRDQVAFNRVNSYISKGRAWTLDADLREEKTVNEELDTAFNDLLEKKGLWANIHAKRERIKRGSGERMRKPGSKGAPTDADFKAAQESVQIDEISQKTLKSYTGKAQKSYDKASRQDTRAQRAGDRAVKKYGEFSHQADAAYAKAEKPQRTLEKRFAGMKMASKKMKEACEVVDRPPVNLKAKKKQQEVQKKIIDEDTPSQREVGTKSLVKKYKSETPGQEKADLNETFNMAWTAGIGVTLSAEECGIKMKPAFELHPDVIDEMERRADYKMVKVRTDKGWVWRKVKNETDVEKDGQ